MDMKKYILIIFLLLLIGWLSQFPLSPKPITIILSPHFDDAVLSLGGLIAKQEYKLLVATFFAKRPTEVMHTEWDSMAGFSNSDEAISTRTKENKTALSPFNAIIKNYDYLELQYRQGSESENEAIKNEIIADILSILKTYKNREIFLYGPTTFGKGIGYPDHEIVHEAFIEIYKTNTNSRIHFFIYEDFPYIRGFIMNDDDNFGEYLNKQTNIQSEELVIELNKLQLQKKIAGIYAYASQIKGFIWLGNDFVFFLDEFFQSRCETHSPPIYACEVVHQL